MSNPQIYSMFSTVEEIINHLNLPFLSDLITFYLFFITVSNAFFLSKYKEINQRRKDQWKAFKG